MNSKYLSLLAAFLIACSGESSTSANGNSVDIPSQGEPTNNFVSEDVSSVDFAFDSSPNFEMESGVIHVTSGDGKANKSIRNWILSANYTRFVACGFVVQIKIGDNMNYAGIQLFKKNSYDDYRFDVHADGKFTINDPGKNILKLSADSSFIKIGEFNQVKVQTTDSGNLQAFVNGHLVKTIDKNDLAFDLTNTDKIAVDYNVLSTATEKTPAEAWVKFESMQNVKD
ncbi:MULTISPECIES: hypothetical protein [unclassified Fibrobacter]|uniref:hypothetical protein n=1 Tax=unclassified Fibrobacter TaxID=2634177 RepID=UPI00091960B2|nr:MULTISPECIES: hypothetical protein [unclassified Fibrobacter]MDO4947919.1 hypothetical protein [Fibrobacter sp.]OWV06417.1 hypothetical protein B7993_05695 [Fibrobacter sp. UWH3]SHL53223.1 hypothetical protein SAMN05720765_11673 [Fibrobacter sp. UWH6]